MEKQRAEYLLSLEISRDDAQSILNQGKGDEGEYLFRRSQRSPNVIVLSMIHAGKVHHFQLERRDFDGHYVTATGLKFPSLEVANSTSCDIDLSFSLFSFIIPLAHD
jgi:hypothetical protein